MSAYIYSEAWRDAGMRALNATSLVALKAALPGLEASVKGCPAPQQEFYQFAFRFCLTVRSVFMPAIVLRMLWHPRTINAPPWPPESERIQ